MQRGMKPTSQASERSPAEVRAGSFWLPSCCLTGLSFAGQTLPYLALQVPPVELASAKDRSFATRCLLALGSTVGAMSR